MGIHPTFKSKQKITWITINGSHTHHQRTDHFLCPKSVVVEIQKTFATLSVLIVKSKKSK